MSDVSERTRRECWRLLRELDALAAEGDELSARQDEARRELQRLVKRNGSRLPRAQKGRDRAISACEAIGVRVEGVRTVVRRARDANRWPSEDLRRRTEADRAVGAAERAIQDLKLYRIRRFLPAVQPYTTQTLASVDRLREDFPRPDRRRSPSRSDQLRDCIEELDQIHKGASSLRQRLRTDLHHGREGLQRRLAELRAEFEQQLRAAPPE